MVEPSLDLLRKQLETAQSEAARLKSGDGGGTFDDMEPRVKALEDKFEKMDGKLDTIIKDVSYLKGKVDSMPTSLQLLGFAIAVFIAAGLLKYLAP